MRFFRVLPRVFYKAVSDTVMQDGVEHAGYMSFLSLLALFPFLVFFVAVAGFIGESAIGTRFVGLVMEQLPDDAIEALRPRLNELAKGPPQGLVTISIIGAIWTASSAVEGLRTILNRAYRVATPPSYLFRRMLSILEFLIMTAVAMVGMILLVIAPIVWDFIEHYPEVARYINPGSGAFRLMVSALMLFFVVSSLYYFLPNIRQPWVRNVPGAVLVVVMWMTGALLFSLYIQNFDQVNIIYGSLGGFIAALLFFYIMHVILIFGAEFNYNLYTALGYIIEQKEEVIREDDDPTRSMGSDI